MARLFDLNIITPERIVYKGKVSSLIAPTELGYIGILADHAALVACLAKGKITLKESSGQVIYLDSPGDGFLEVANNNVNLLFSSPALTTT